MIMPSTDTTEPISLAVWGKRTHITRLPTSVFYGEEQPPRLEADDAYGLFNLRLADFDTHDELDQNENHQAIHCLDAWWPTEQIDGTSLLGWFEIAFSPSAAFPHVPLDLLFECAFYAFDFMGQWELRRLQLTMESRLTCTPHAFPHFTPFNRNNMAYHLSDSASILIHSDVPFILVEEPAGRKHVVLQQHECQENAIGTNAGACSSDYIQASHRIPRFHTRCTLNNDARSDVLESLFQALTAAAQHSDSFACVELIATS